jgi:hypothetical protein
VFSYSIITDCPPDHKDIRRITPTINHIQLIDAETVLHCLETAEEASANPISAPTTAPDQGLAVMPQVLPEHLPRYPMMPPTAMPTIVPMIYFIILTFMSGNSAVQDAFHDGPDGAQLI